MMVGLVAASALVVGDAAAAAFRPFEDGRMSVSTRVSYAPVVARPSPLGRFASAREVRRSAPVRVMPSVGRRLFHDVDAPGP